MNLLHFDHKPYFCLTDDDSEHKKAKGTKKFVVKRTLKFNNYKKCSFKKEIILKSQQTFKIEAKSNDNKRLQTFEGIATYSC